MWPPYHTNKYHLWKRSYFPPLLLLIQFLTPKYLKSQWHVTNTMRWQLAGWYIGINMQMSSLKTPIPCCEAGNAQGYLCSDKNTSFTLMKTVLKAWKTSVFSLYKIKQDVKSAGDVKNNPQNVYLSHFVGNLNLLL